MPLRKTVSKKKVKEAICLECHNPFLKYTRFFRNKSRMSDIRGCKMVTCSKECSKIYNHKQNLKTSKENQNEKRRRNQARNRKMGKDNTGIPVRKL